MYKVHVVLWLDDVWYPVATSVMFEVLGGDAVSARDVDGKLSIALDETVALSKVGPVA